MSSNTSLIKDKGRKRTLSESYESVLFLFILRHRKLTNYFFKEDKKGANLREKTLKFAPKRVGHRFKSYPKACFDHLHLFICILFSGMKNPQKPLWDLGISSVHLFCTDTLVAGMGFEPHDLRVMSPTSYQAALPRDIESRKNKDTAWCRWPGSNRYER